MPNLPVEDARENPKSVRGFDPFGAYLVDEPRGEGGGDSAISAMPEIITALAMKRPVVVTGK